jgi:hypothetical protein
VPTTHPLFETLSAILPAPSDTRLLRACIQKGEPAREACDTWLKSHADTKSEYARESVKSLLPLLFSSVRSHSIPVSSAFLTVLRTAALREQLRTKTYYDICRRVLSTLARNAIPAILVQGAALGKTVYPDPALRHSHRIDIITERRHINALVGLLAPLGFSRSAKTWKRDRHDIEIIHETGLPLAVHHELFEIPFYNAAFSDLYSRAVPAVVCDIPIEILSPADALLHVCGHATYSGRHESLWWVIDSWFIVDRCRDLDWDLLLETAKRSHLALPLSVMLTYLAEELNAPIPASFLHGVSATACKVPSIDCELALFAARQSPRCGFKQLIRDTRNWRGRLYVIKWMLLPSATYTLWVSQLRHLWLLPVQYLYRPLRYVSARIRPFFASFAGRTRRPGNVIGQDNSRTNI